MGPNRGGFSGLRGEAGRRRCSSVSSDKISRWRTVRNIGLKLGDGSYLRLSVTLVEGFAKSSERLVIDRKFELCLYPRFPRGNRPATCKFTRQHCDGERGPSCRSGPGIVGEQHRPD